MFAVEILTAAEEHISGITEIYNWAILNTTATFDTEIKSLDDRREWLSGHGGRQPVIVAVDGGRVVGWASVTQYSPRLAYRYTGEDSIYVHPDHFGKGIGKALLKELIALTREKEYVTLLGRVVDGNETSIKLHNSLGFSTVGKLTKVGRKFDMWLDVLFMQIML
jgi:phosphinothricin acetyltransferase